MLTKFWTKKKYCLQENVQQLLARITTSGKEKWNEQKKKEKLLQIILDVRELI